MTCHDSQVTLGPNGTTLVVFKPQMILDSNYNFDDLKLIFNVSLNVIFWCIIILNGDLKNYNILKIHFVITFHFYIHVCWISFLINFPYVFYKITYLYNIALI